MPQENAVLHGDCREVMKGITANSISSIITDPPYNYEFIGKEWDHSEIQRRIDRSKESTSSTLVKNIPYGSGLAGGVRNQKWYERNRQNVLDYQSWMYTWGTEAFRVAKPGAYIAVFNSTRTIAHVQIALEEAGFYARDTLVYRRHSGIPKGLNASAKLRSREHPDAEKWQGWHSALRNEWEAIVLLQKPLDNDYLTNLERYGVGLMMTSTIGEGFQSNILEGFSNRGNDAGLAHCTPKPLDLMSKLVKLFVPTGKDHIILDPFAGSGTTLVAARMAGNSYIGIEIVEEYFKFINKRLSKPQITMDLLPFEFSK